MQEFLLVIHIIICAVMIGAILLQKSEGGALGMGGGGGGGFMTGRGQANFLTRVTAGLAIAFFVTSVLLTVLAQRGGGGEGILDRLQRGNAPLTGTTPASPAPTGQTPATGGGILDKLQNPPAAPATP